MLPRAPFFLSNNPETDKVLATLINLHAYEQHTSFGRTHTENAQTSSVVGILRDECLSQCDLQLS
jgi:hypothetical protein